MKKAINMTLSLLLLFAFVLGGSVHGFADIAADQGKAEIMALKESHLISGIGGNKFGPNQKLTNAQGVVMIIKGLNLNIDHLRFIKQPLASDYYTNIDDDAWYAHALIVAQYAGLDLPKDIDPHAVMTKEAFTHYLFQGIMQTGNYAFIELLININDSDDINKDYFNSVQKMLIAKIAKLDDKQNFNPKEDMTRSSAAVMLHRAITFVKKNQKTIIDDKGDNNGVKVYTSNVTDEVQKVTLDWGEQPNPGYGLSISKITFDHSNQKATIFYKLHYPDPNRMYPQVIVHVKADTFVPTGFEIDIKHEAAKELLKEKHQPAVKSIKNPA